MKSRSRTGFTMIELITVVIVIGVLAGTAITKYSDYTGAARKNSCILNQDAITRAIRQAEIKYGPLDANSVMRLHVDGIVDSTPNSLYGSSTSYRIFLGEVPTPWGVTSTGSNATVRELAADQRFFRCPEDQESLGLLNSTGAVSYSGISNVVTQDDDRPGTVLGLFPTSFDPNTYTYAKRVHSDRTTWSAATPWTSTDPLEGYNWIQQSIVWKMADFTFCRRWGLRNPTATGSGVLAGQTADKNYVPAEQADLAHSEFTSR